MALQEWINSKYSSVVVDTVFVDQQSAIMQRYYLCSSSALTYSLQWSNLSYLIFYVTLLCRDGERYH